MKKKRQAIQQWAVSSGLLFNVTHADKKQWIIVCKKPNLCDFQIQLTYFQKLNHVKITVFKPHTCSIFTHYNWQQANSANLLASHSLNIAAVTDNCRLKPRQL